MTTLSWLLQTEKKKKNMNIQPWIIRKSQLNGKDPDAGKDWKQKEKGVAEDEMVWWHHQLIEH